MGLLTSLLHELLQIAWDTLVYWGSFFYFWWWNQPINTLEIFGQQRLPLCHVYMLAKTLHLWDEPHYRAKSFADDLRANLRNVAVPGTGIPLSVFCANKATALCFIVLVNPLLTLIAAAYCCCSQWARGAWSRLQQQQQPVTNATSTPSSQPASLAATYRQLLLFPDHWFAIWRHSCLLVGYHALVTGSSSYRMEAKGTFLLEGQRMGLPVSPFYNEGTVFVKHVSVEGGMGIHVFRNFAQGGEWVIQRALSNSAALSKMLPAGAPLSTLRVVTASTAWLGTHATSTATTRSTGGGGGAAASTRQRSSSSSSGSSDSRGSREGQEDGGVDSSSNSRRVVGRLTPDLPLSVGVMQQQQQQGSAAAASLSPLSIQQTNSSNRSSRDGSATQQQQQPMSSCHAAGSTAVGVQGSGALYDGCVQVVTAVWRAGLAGKDTDHSSICFPVDPHSGQLGLGVSSNHWYKLGAGWVLRLDRSTAGRVWLEHPDSASAPIAGRIIPDIPNILRMVLHAHMVATPDVPLVGWDVAITPDGVFLLEMNLSCNLFNGTFDSKHFYDNTFAFLSALDALDNKSNTCRHKSWGGTVDGHMVNTLL